MSRSSRPLSLDEQAALRAIEGGAVPSELIVSWIVADAHSAEDEAALREIDRVLAEVSGHDPKLSDRDEGNRIAVYSNRNWAYYEALRDANLRGAEGRE